MSQSSHFEPGTVIDHFTVVGPAPLLDGNYVKRSYVKCECGRVVSRYNVHLRRPTKTPKACGKCEYSSKVHRREVSKKQTGYKPFDLTSLWFKSFPNLRQFSHWMMR